MTKNKMTALTAAILRNRAVKDAEYNLAAYTLDVANNECKTLNMAVNMGDDNTLAILAKKYNV